ncbi:MAG TPA: 5-formyltetrahydrofolate cyclo-ligase [Bauldia sp.]|nr:5-formyltetrahydrofolate cyclo-ligase [Bauldia sp.]
MIAGIRDKSTLRAEALARRDTLTTSERENGSRFIAARAIAIIARVRPAVIAAYMPIWSEVDPGPIVAWAHEQRIAVVLPAVIGAAEVAFRVHRPGDELEIGRFGTRAPAANVPTADPDLVISPMIAFDRTGTRLGHGLGYYDRAIAALVARGRRPRLLGVAFSVQEVSAIPAEAHDARMEWIVTERETITPAAGQERT